jgi:hypothetical protein
MSPDRPAARLLKLAAEVHADLRAAGDQADILDRA